MHDARSALARLLKQESVRRGDFTLASGRQSNVYVDARRTTMSARGQYLIGRIGLDALRRNGWADRADAVGGMTLGADPVAYAIAHASAAAEAAPAQGSGSGADRDETRELHAAARAGLLNGFTVRKQPKGHGAGRQIEGPLDEGQRVVLVEDVVTTGGSALEAAGVLEAFGAEIVGVLTVVDRQEGGRAAIEAAGYELVALFGVDELLDDGAASGAASSNPVG